MHARNRLHVLVWPFHNGLRDVSMGSGPIRLADDPHLGADLEAEGWTVTIEEIEAVDESDPEIVRVIELIRRLASATWRAIKKTASTTRTSPRSAARSTRSASRTPSPPCTAASSACIYTSIWTRSTYARLRRTGIRRTPDRLEIAGAAITAYDPALDPDGRTMSAARAVAGEIARGIRFQPTSGTG